MLHAMEDERFFWEEWISEDAEESLCIHPACTFGELTSKLGLLWSCGAWDDTARQMVEQKEYALSDLITCREDVFFYLKSHGFSDKDGRRGDGTGQQREKAAFYNAGNEIGPRQLDDGPL